MESDKPSGKNIILLTIDCLRADHLHCMGYEKNISPNIDKLAKNGIKFTNMITNGPHTPYAVPALLSSKLPPVTKRPQDTIASVLRKHGYLAAAINPNPVIFSTVAGGGGTRVDKDFDHYDMMTSPTKRYGLSWETLRMMFMRFLRDGLGEKSFLYRALYFLYDKALQAMPGLLCPKQHLYLPLADELNTQALEWVKKHKDKNFFLWIHYMDVHEPYAPPTYPDQNEMLYLIAKYRDFPNLLTKEEIKKIITLYDLEIEYTDKSIGKFVENLKKIGLYDNSIIIISADHGDAFGEHGTLGHGGHFDDQVYDEVLHIPFIVHGLKKGVVDDKPLQIMDISPTICDMVGVPIPPLFDGESAFTSKKKGIVSNSKHGMSYRTKKYKLIINKSDSKENELYNIVKDPKEQNNIYNESKDVAKELEMEMIKILSSYRKKKKLLEVKIPK